MLPKIIEILIKSNGYESFSKICQILKNECPNETSKLLNFEKTVLAFVEKGYDLGLISSSKQIKLTVDLNNTEDAKFQSMLQILIQEIAAQNNIDSAGRVPERSCRVPTRKRNRPDNCGPGWNLVHPLVQRQGVVTRRRSAALEEAEQRMRDARQGSRSRSRSRSRSQSQSE